MRTKEIETALHDDWWAGEDEAWEAGMLALVVVACTLLAVAAVGVYRVLGFLAV